MAKVKVINTNLNQNLNGDYFNDTPSNTIFSFGSFYVTSNFSNQVVIDYTNTLSSFAIPVTLDTINVTNTQSQILYNNNNNAVLNLDKSDLNTFVRFGSAYELLRVSIQNIILAYPVVYSSIHNPYKVEIQRFLTIHMIFQQILQHFMFILHIL